MRVLLIALLAAISYAQTVCVPGAIEVSRFDRFPGFYFCDCVFIDDPCLLEYDCIPWKECPEVNNTAINPDNVTCPSDATLAPSFDFQFINSTVVHRNLNGKFCDPAAWNIEGDGRAKDGSILDLTYPPPSCIDKDYSIYTERNDDYEQSIQEILFMNVGTVQLQQFDFNTIPIGLRVVDISDTVAGTLTEVGDHEYGGYECQNTYKCGNVKEGDSFSLLSNNANSNSGSKAGPSYFGQVQLDLNGKAMKLSFSIVYCCIGGDCCTRDGNGNCIMNQTNFVPIGCKFDGFGNCLEHCDPNNSTIDGNGTKCEYNYKGFNSTNCRTIPFDSMVMTFLDIDGNNQNQEFLVGHDLYTYLFGSKFVEPQVKLIDHDGTVFLKRQYFDAQNVYDDFIADWQTQNPDPAFVDMKIRVYDPDRVYFDRKCNANETTLQARACPNQWNNRTGDVTFTNANRDDTMVSMDSNGDFQNPADIFDLSPGQIQRGVQMVWASDRVTAYAQCLSNIPDRCAFGDADCALDEQIDCQATFQNASISGRQESFNVTFGTQKRTIEFAGYSQGLAGPECKTCETGFFIDNNECPGNRPIEHRNRVCLYDPIILEDRCGVEYCCSPGITLRPSTSHGDPIIWTFNDECYDLNKDGLYLATSHPDFDHDVYIAVYNNYMREIQVVDRETEDILLAVSTLGEVFKSDDFKFYYAHKTLDCPDDMKETECNGQYEDFRFDAQSFRFAAMLLRHDYLDPALNEGELGYHFDIYPAPYTSFLEKQDGYTGLYFENPLPEELEYCPGGSPRRQ